MCAWLLANCEVQLCSALAAVSILGVVVMCPMMLDPSIDTLVSSFDEGMCQTVYKQFLRGLSNCTWTSCREGCTAEVYSCYHVVVVYVKGTADEFDASHKKSRASANHLNSPNSIRLDVQKGVDGLNKINNQQPANVRERTAVAIDEDDISADIIESILGGSVNDSIPARLSSTSSPNLLSATNTTQHTPIKSGQLQFDQHNFKLDAEDRGGESNGFNYILPPDHDLQVYEYNNTFVRDLDANLNSMMNQIRQGLEIEGWSEGGGSGSYPNELYSNLSLLGIGALLPNIKGCVYPSEITCKEFIHKYGRVGGPVFPCYISKFNSSTVVTTVDKAAAVRHIFYSFIPLVIASGVFTYLFYRVGLIGSSNKRKKDEETGSDEEGGSQRFNKEKGRLQNGAPPVVRKKMRKKFLPNRDSSKKRRKGKIFNKKNLLSIKQMSIKSPSSSRRDPSMSIGAISDDGYGGGNNYARTSVQLS